MKTGDSGFFMPVLENLTLRVLPPPGGFRYRAVHFPQERRGKPGSVRYLKLPVCSSTIQRAGQGSGVSPGRRCNSSFLFLVDPPASGPYSNSQNPYRVLKRHQDG